MKLLEKKTMQWHGTKNKNSSSPNQQSFSAFAQQTFAAHEARPSLRRNPALTSDRNALRAWGHKNFGAFAPCKRFAQQNLGGGRIHFARAFQFPERNPKKEVTTYVVTSFFGAGDEARTRYLHLGKVALYQMSYARGTLTIIADSFAFVKPYFSFFRRFWSCRLANAEKL